MLVDYRSHPRYYPRVVSAELVEADAQHALVRYEVGVGPFSFGFYMIKYPDPVRRRIDWRLDTGHANNFFRENTGYWQVDPADGGSLVTFGRIRALVKKAPPRKDAFDINEAIHEVVGLTRGEVVKNNVSVQTQLAEGLPRIQGDTVQLQQVILNLIINAVEAMSGISDGPRELLISTMKDAGGVLVAVRDSGPGLSPENCERLFDAFYTTKPDGMGMGLSICRSIVDAHGGRIWASPAVGRGATFQFGLPLAGA